MSRLPAIANPQRQLYPSDLSDSEWEILKPLIPKSKGFGYPIEVDFREIFNGIFYVQRTGCQNVVAVDLGINTTATVAVVALDGTVIHREFIHPGRDIDEVAAAAGRRFRRNGDRRDQRLKSVSMRASKTMGTCGNLHKGFCCHTYRKCRNINTQISHIVSKRIVQIAAEFNSEVIRQSRRFANVFENLKGWKAKGGRKRSNLRQRFHGWLKAKIRDYTEMKWLEAGGKVIDVVAAYTSKLAYDGSGTVKRDSKNYALAAFPSGKQFNADLNGTYNIAARGILKLTRRNGSEERSSKRSGRSPRSWVCLCDLWTRNSSRLACDTPTSASARWGELHIDSP